MTVKPWELAKWAREQAARLGLSLDAAAAKALVAQVGERQQRLLRELEKLALEGDPGDPADGRRRRATHARRPRQVSVEDIERRAAHSTEWRAYALADALVGGDGREATLSYLRLREQGERLSGLTYLMAQRLRDALAVAQRLQAGESVAEVKRGLRMPARAAERFVADVARSDLERLRARARRARRARARHARRRPARRQPHRARGPGRRTRSRCGRSRHRRVATSALAEAARYLPARVRAARDFLRAPVFLCIAPRLTALSIVLTSSR